MVRISQAPRVFVSATNFFLLLRNPSHPETWWNHRILDMEEK